MSNSSLVTINDKVKLETHNNKPRTGTVRFIGELNGKTGIYYGVELDISNLNSNISSNGLFAFVKKSELTIITKSDMIRVTVGDIVNIAKCECCGIIRYIGDTEFKSGVVWYGIQLEEPKGKNNGIVNDVKYFLCDDKYGIFVKEAQIGCVQKKKSKKKKKAKHHKHKQKNVNKDKVNVFGQNMAERDTVFLDEKQKVIQKNVKYLKQLKKLQNTDILGNKTDMGRLVDSVSENVTKID